MYKGVNFSPLGYLTKKNGSFTIQNYKIREKEEFCVLQEMRTKLKSRKGDHRPKHAFDLKKNNPHGQKFIAYI
jgi:hypothetical protein